MVPVSIYGDDPAGMYANQVMACVVNLPVGEPGASMRLHQIAFAMRQQMEGGQAVGATSLANLAGFAPPTSMPSGPGSGPRCRVALQRHDHQRPRAADAALRR